MAIFGTRNRIFGYWLDDDRNNQKILPSFLPRVWLSDLDRHDLLDVAFVCQRFKL